MVRVDLNWPVHSGHNPFKDRLKGRAHAQWTNHFLTTANISTQATIRHVRKTISRQLSRQNLFLLRSISMHGICPDNVPTKSERHRVLSESYESQALSLWYSRPRLTQYVGQSKRKSRLANLRRLRSSLDTQGSPTLCQRRPGASIEANGLCTRCHHHRSVFVTISMGQIPKAQSGSQAAYPDGSKRLYTLLYPHYRRKGARRQCTRSPHFGAGCLLRYGPRVSRFFPFVQVHSKSFNIRDTGQVQFRLSPTLPSACRHIDRLTLRSNDPSQRLLCIQGLPCGSSQDQLYRCDYATEACLLNQ